MEAKMTKVIERAVSFGSEIVVILFDIQLLAYKGKNNGSKRN